MPFDTRLSRTVLKVVVPLLATAAVVLVTRRRRPDTWRDDLALRRPPAITALAWLGLYLLWILGTDWAIGRRGPWDFTPWTEAPLLIDVMRVLGVGILGPIAEELIFRGIILTRLANTPLKPTGAVLVVAAVWAGLHTAYGGDVLTVIFVAGLLLGAARYRTGSIVAPILMHIAWNLYAVW